ncbi:hypothetical protein MHYP_G00085370 [Metynnis hypsauchen]
MKTLVRLMLVYMLFSEALQGSSALRCYQCDSLPCNPKPTVCSRYEDRCVHASLMGTPYTVKGCVTKAKCEAAGRIAACCDTDLCNKDLLTPPSLKCYECMGLPCTHKPITCPSSADRCYTSTMTAWTVLTHTIKGCSTKDACDKTGKDIVCCKGNLCNSAEGVKLSLLIMLVPLMPSFLFI